MFPPLQRVRHLGRYREIAQVMIKYGFGDLVSRIGLLRQLSLPRSTLRRTSQLVPDTPTRVRLGLQELGPTFVKLGQILSTRPDLLPPPFINELEKLQDTVPPADWLLIRPRLEEELGRPLEEVFASIEPQPLAAASLAQVHAARLLDGTEVVIKIQRPDIERIIEIDLEILFDLANLVQAHTPLGELYDLPAITEHFAFTLRTELDYRREAAHAERFRRNFAEEPYLYIPRIYADYTTHRMLVIERIHGVKIDDLEGLRAAGYDPRQVAMKAARIIAKEVLEDGFFHADPHPGNFVVMEGEVIGAMDFGMVGWLEPRDRLELIALYTAIVRVDADGIVEHLTRMGMADLSVDRDGLRRDIARLLREYEGLPLRDIRLKRLLEELMPIAFRYRLSLPSDLWLLTKTLVVMEGVGSKLDPDFDIFAVSGPVVKRLSGEMLMPRTWGPEALKVTDSWANLLMLMPEVGTGVLRRLRRGELPLALEHKGLDQALNRIDRIAGRLSLSIVVAGLTIGLAMVIPTLGLTQHDGLLFYLMIAAFVVAVLLGIGLLISILRAGL
jgi:ubiquinone biosynthesis protein